MNYTPTLERDPRHPIGMGILHCVENFRTNLHTENLLLAVLPKTTRIGSVGV